MSIDLEGYKVVIVILALGIPAVLILFGLISQLSGFLNPQWMKNGYIYVTRGVVIYIVELRLRLSQKPMKRKLARKLIIQVTATADIDHDVTSTGFCYTLMVMTYAPSPSA